MTDLLFKSIIPLLFFLFFLLDAYAESRDKSDAFIKLKLPPRIRKILYPFGSAPYVTLYFFVRIIAKLSCLIIYSLVVIGLEFFSQIDIQMERLFFKFFIPLVFAIYICGSILSFCIVLIERMKQRGFHLIAAILLIISIFSLVAIFVYILYTIPILVCILEDTGTALPS